MTRSSAAAPAMLMAARYRRVRPRLTFARLQGMRSVAAVQYAVLMGILIYAAVHGAQSMGYNWQWYRVPRYFYNVTDAGFEWGPIPKGLLGTLAISSVSFALAMVLGFAVAALRQSRLIVGHAVAVGFLELVRNLPLLVLLYLFYYVLGPIFGLDRVTASIACLGVFHAATISEIVRAGVASVERGQWEAATSIGMSRVQSFRYIVLPQSVRFMLPPMTGEVVNMIKSSAIVSVIAVGELTTAGRTIISDTYLSFEIWFTIAGVYLATTLLISIAASRLETRYAVQT